MRKNSQNCFPSQPVQLLQALKNSSIHIFHIWGQILNLSPLYFSETLRGYTRPCISSGYSSCRQGFLQPEAFFDILYRGGCCDCRKIPIYPFCLQGFSSTDRLRMGHSRYGQVVSLKQPLLPLPLFTHPS